MFRMKHIGGFILVISVAFTLISSTATSAEKITLKLNWVPGGDHCFYFVAKEMGYYKEKGVDVNIERGRGSGDTVKRVDAVFDWVVGNLQYWEAGLDKDKLMLIPWAK